MWLDGVHVRDTHMLFTTGVREVFFHPEELKLHSDLLDNSSPARPPWGASFPEVCVRESEREILFVCVCVCVCVCVSVCVCVC